MGFQHYILALGTAVMIPSFLVPLMGGNDVSSFSTMEIYIFYCYRYYFPPVLIIEKQFSSNQDDKVRVVQTLLFVEGINTLLQTLFGTRLPTVIGGSYAFMVPIISIIHDSSLTRIENDHIVSSILFYKPKKKKKFNPFLFLVLNLSNGDPCFVCYPGVKT